VFGKRRLNLPLKLVRELGADSDFKREIRSEMRTGTLVDDRHLIPQIVK
jgi:hypothetical protein